MNKKKVIIIGAGFGGLSAAALLAKKGFQVQVYEKNEQAGGRASVFQDKGFVFDMGPSWYLMPDVFEHFFKLFDKQSRDFYSLTRLDPAYRIFYGANDYIDTYKDLEKNIALFESLEQGAGKKLIAYLQQAQYQYDVSIKDFLYRDYHSIIDFFNWRMMMEGRKLHVFEKLDQFTKRFFKQEKVRKILEYSMVFLGGAPKNTPAIYSLMAHVDFNLGVWYPDGGFGKVVEGLVRLAEDQGVQFHYNSAVEEIVVHNGVAVGVKISGEFIEADIVLANADYHFVETQLLKPEYQTYKAPYWAKRTIAPSGFILYLGVNKKIKGLTHHNLIFDHDWVRHFDNIFEQPAWPEHPSYYVCCPSKTDSTVAPVGKENLFILVPVAAGLNDSDVLRESYTHKIIEHLESMVGETIADSLEVKKVFSQRDFISRYHAYKGTALGMSHTMRQTALFRPKHQSKKVSNLFYTGQYTHPGIGVPMCLISSEIVAEQISNMYGE
jgi:phytoene desaturase